MKKTIMLGAVSMAMFATGAAAYASDAIQAANNHVSFQAGVSDLSYSERDNANQLGDGRDLDREDADQAVFRTELSRQGAVFGVNDVFSSLGVTVATGSTHYSGYSQNLANANRLGDALSYSHSSTMLDLDLKLGKGFRVMPKLQLTPYVRYDFNLWGRSSLETYTHHELGLGLLTQYAVTPKLVVGVDASLSKMFGSNLDTKDGVSEQPASRWSQNVGVTGDYALSKRLHLLASYQFRHFSYGRSEDEVGVFDHMQATWFEPSSSTTTHQFLVGLSYNFF